MNPPTVLFTGTQAAQPVSAQSSERFSAPSLATAAPINVGIRPHPGAVARPKQRTLMPIAVGALIGLALLLGIVLIIALGKRGSADNPAPLSSAPSSTAAAPVANAPLELSPATQETEAARPSNPATPQVAPAAPGTPPAAVELKPAAAPALALPTLPALPALNPARPAAPATTHAAPSARCFADPFTGQVRVADAAHAAQSFACKQNPFTGAFQRL
jgi:hypothetical protein